MEDRKQLIVETAKKLFADKGYAATGLRSIAEKADVSIGNIYNYFKNKEEIIKYILSPEVVLPSFYPLQEFIGDEFPNNLGLIITAVGEIVKKEMDLLRLILIDLTEFNGKHTDKVMEVLLSFGDFVFENLLDKQFVGKELRNGDYKLLTSSFIVTVITFMVTSNIVPSASLDKYKKGEYENILSDVLLNGILKERNNTGRIGETE